MGLAIANPLMVEGIIFSDSGVAAQHQRIGAEELVALIETLDEDNDAGLEPVAVDAGIADLIDPPPLLGA